MSVPLRAPRYLARFRCLAEACPDTCCAGFVVRLDRTDLQRVDDAVSGSKDLKARRKRSIEPEEDEDGTVASLHQGDGCAFLDADKLCTLIKRKGQEGIPDACALYPRTLSYFPDHVELRATAGCPEIARSLVTEADALDVGDVDASAAARVPEAGVRRPPTVYTSRRDQVLALGDAVLGSSGAVAAKLGVLARFAAAVDGTFHRTSDALEEAAFEAAANQAGARKAKTTAAAWVKDAPDDDRILAAQVIFGVVMNLREEGSRRYATLLDAALASYQRSLPEETGNNVFAGLALAFQRRRDAIAAALEDELELPLARFVLNEWHRVWFTQSHSLAAHLFKLLLEVAAIRVMLIGHPAIAEYADARARGAAADIERLRPQFTQALIDCLQIVARRVGSSDGLLDALEKQLGPADLGTDVGGRLRMLLTYC